MGDATRLVTALNGSPLAGSSIDALLEALAAGVREAGGAFEAVRCQDLTIKPCQACGPDPTGPDEMCIYHDDMDRVFALLERAHAVVVASPVYFDAVSGPLKQVMDRCNCVTPLSLAPDGGWTFRPRWARTRRGVFVTACSSRHRYDLAERSVRGYLKWIGAKWEETIVWQHEDNARGSVAGAADLLARARAVGRRLIESAPLAPEAVA
jgi:multimeric flavodoxin WrbA